METNKDVQYRVQFFSNGKLYEIYARSVGPAGIYGFIEIGDFIFNGGSKILLDPSEEAIKREFENVKRIYIPFHSVIRIDELPYEVEAKSRIVPIKDRKGGNFFPFLIDGGGEENK